MLNKEKIVKEVTILLTDSYDIVYPKLAELTTRFLIKGRHYTEDLENYSAYMLKGISKFIRGDFYDFDEFKTANELLHLLSGNAEYDGPLTWEDLLQHELYQLLSDYLMSHFVSTHGIDFIREYIAEFVIIYTTSDSDDQVLKYFSCFLKNLDVFFNQVFDILDKFKDEEMNKIKKDGMTDENVKIKNNLRIRKILNEKIGII